MVCYFQLSSVQVIGFEMVRLVEEELVVEGVAVAEVLVVVEKAKYILLLLAHLIPYWKIQWLLADNPCRWYPLIPLN